MQHLLTPMVDNLPQAVDDAVTAYRAAVISREHAWDTYTALLEEHNRRVRAAQLTLAFRPPRRRQALMLAERGYASAEHRASAARARIEMEVRAANPGAQERAIMATARALA